jgi:uncharacterized protein YebE (UPF0316 family)
VTLDFTVWPVWVGALAIFLSRIVDVSLGTLRIAFISRGEKSLAPVIGFFEMLVWLFAIGQLVQNLTNAAYYVAYAAGFASGIYLGLRIEDRIALGSRMIRTITLHDAADLLGALRAAGYGVTSVQAEGATGEVNLLFSVLKRAQVRSYMAIVEELHPEAFSSIEEVRSVHQGFFRVAKPAMSFGGLRPFLLWKR